MKTCAPFPFYNPIRERPLIWEQNDLYINYLLNYKGARLIETDNAKAVVLTDDLAENIWFSNLEEDMVVPVVHKLFEQGNKKLNIQSLDLEQISKLSVMMQTCDYTSKITHKTSNEIIYSVSSLQSLEVYNFRHAYKHLIENGALVFEKVSESNLIQAEEVLKSWRDTQGTKYTEDLRAQKDSFYLDASMAFPQNAISILGYLDDKPVSIMTAGINGDTASIILNKTLSGYKDQAGALLGKRGVTEASYLLLSDHLSGRNVAWMNDGDSLPGSGAERRKLSWKPETKIDSFILSVHAG